MHRLKHTHTQDWISTYQRSKFPSHRFPQGWTVRWREALLLKWIAVRVWRQECVINIEWVWYPQCWIGPSEKVANTLTCLKIAGMGLLSVFDTPKPVVKRLFCKRMTGNPPRGVITDWRSRIWLALLLSWAEGFQTFAEDTYSSYMKTCE